MHILSVWLSFGIGRFTEICKFTEMRLDNSAIISKCHWRPPEEYYKVVGKIEGQAMLIQCGGVITRPILSQMLTIDDP